MFSSLLNPQIRYKTTKLLICRELISTVLLSLSGSKLLYKPFMLAKFIIYNRNFLIICVIFIICNKNYQIGCNRSCWQLSSCCESFQVATSWRPHSEYAFCTRMFGGIPYTAHGAQISHPCFWFFVFFLIFIYARGTNTAGSLLNLFPSPARQV